MSAVHNTKEFRDAVAAAVLAVFNDFSEGRAPAAKAMASGWHPEGYPDSKERCHKMLLSHMKELGLGDGERGYIEHADESEELRKDVFSFEGELLFAFDTIGIKFRELKAALAQARDMMATVTETAAHELDDCRIAAALHRDSINNLIGADYDANTPISNWPEVVPTSLTDNTQRVENVDIENLFRKAGGYTNLDEWRIDYGHFHAAMRDIAQAITLPVLKNEQVEWVVNSEAELGVKIGNQFFFLYKGGSLVYEDAEHDDGTPMQYRAVFTREFGECAHPINHKDYSKIGTVSLNDSDDWKPLPKAEEVTK